jgi:hypothetical protein
VDERREITWLIHNLETIIPCHECRMHVREFKKSVPIAGEYGLWFWQLHESVNQRLGKPGFTYTPDIGSGIHVRNSWKIYTNILRESILLGSVKGDSVKDYTRHIGLWAGFAGV